MAQILAFVVFLLFLPSQSCSQTTDTMIIQVCSNIDNQTACLSNIKNLLEKSIPYQKNPNSVLKAAIRSTINEAKLAMDMISKFNTLSVTSREQMAIQDCQELLDYSVSELAWSLTVLTKIRESHSRNVHYESALKAWLSAALSNQDTCLEGFEGTDKRLERFVKGSLKQVSQLISNVLGLYSHLHSVPIKPSQNNTSSYDHNSTMGTEFPEWMVDEDRDIILTGAIVMHVDSVVSVDGSGRFRTIAEAIYAAPSYSKRRYVIYVKKGVYRENIDLKKKKTNIMLIGDGIGVTIVTGDRNFMQGWTTFRTATIGKNLAPPGFVYRNLSNLIDTGSLTKYCLHCVAVSGRGFIARDMTFRNTAGPQNHQAVALRVDSDQSAFYRCSMEGYQDTLYAHSLRQFYRECNIYGTIDFIMGNGAAVMQNCKIFTRTPLPMQKVTITAQGRKNPNQSTGFSIQDSYVYASQPTYLGRPWKQFSRTVFMNTYMSSQVQPRGWLEWYGDFALSTLWYGEYRNYGPGASLSGRVRWPGYHVIKEASTASFFTVRRFIDGISWLPSTGVKFSAGLRT